MLANIDIHHLPILLIIGFALFFGGLGAKLFQRLRIPQVVGYIVIGVILGQTGLKLIDAEAILQMRLFNFVALGVIGFMIGGELKIPVFRKYGRQFLIILFSEGLVAFVFVAVAITGLSLLLGQDPMTSIALGLVLGAIASATAPAATVDVLWEYKTKGPLTTAVFALVALDDGLALVLYGLAAGIAKVLIGSGEAGIGSALLRTGYELGGALALGVAAGLLLNLILRIARDHDKHLVFVLGTLILVIGLSLALEMDVILGAMALGMTLVNLAPRRSHESFGIVERFTPPIYVLFFVIVGARLAIGEMPGWMWGLAGAFVVGRSVGKMTGASLGAKLGGASKSLQKYLGLCLFSQAGVAIGLAILSSESFTGEYEFLGQAVVMIVTATTFLVQVIGPPSVKWAVTQAGEVGLNVTRDDLIAQYRVAEVMNADPVRFREDDTFQKIMRTLSETEAMTYPVVDDEDNMLGVITIADLKSGLGSEHLSHLLVAYDLMKPPVRTIGADQPLTEAITRMREQELDYLPVLETAGGAEAGPSKLVGLLEQSHLDRRLSQELIRRRETAIDHEQTQILRAAIERKRRR